MGATYMDPCKRLEKYIANVERVINEIEILDSECEKVVALARTYLEDSKYYLSKGDCVTGLVTISYAEGLLDALRAIGGVSFEWKTHVPIEERIVLAAGSFDIVHPGHVEFLKWASSLGTKLFVIIARDSTYRRLRGFEPVLDEVSRLRVVSSIRYVYRAMLGDEKDFLKPVEIIKPRIIALGPDQEVDERWLSDELRRRGLEDIEIARMSSRLEGFSSSLIKSRLAKMLGLNVEG